MSTLARQSTGERIGHVLLGVGGLALVVAVTWMALSLGNGADGHGGEEGGDGALGGRPVISSPEAVRTRFALGVDESGRFGPPVVAVSAGAEQVCSVLLGDGAASWSDADVEWSRAGLLVEGDTELQWSVDRSSIGHCLLAPGLAEPGIISVRWSVGDQELTDAVVVGDPDATGLVEISNAGSDAVCALSISPGDLLTTGNDLRAALDSDRRTRLEVAVGVHQFEAQDCEGQVAARGEVTVEAQLTLLVIGRSDPDDSGPDDSDTDDGSGPVPADSAEVVVGSGPIASDPVWTSGVDDVGVPVDELVFVGPENERNFCLTWSYLNVPAGSSFELVWSVDGVTGPGDVVSGTTSPPADGNFWGCYGNPNGLPDGRYEVEWRVEGEPVFSESITVGSVAATSISIRNESADAVCFVGVAETGASTLGLNSLEQPLDPGVSINESVSSSTQDIVAADCAGRIVWSGRNLEVPAGRVIVVAG